MALANVGGSETRPPGYITKPSGPIVVTWNAGTTIDGVSKSDYNNYYLENGVVPKLCFGSEGGSPLSGCYALPDCRSTIYLDTHSLNVNPNIAGTPVLAVLAIHRAPHRRQDRSHARVLID